MQQRRADEDDEKAGMARLVAEGTPSGPSTREASRQSEAVEHHLRHTPRVRDGPALVEAVEGEGRNAQPNDPARIERKIEEYDGGQRDQQTRDAAKQRVASVW